MGIMGSIKAFLMVILGVLGIIKDVREEKKAVEQKNVGKSEVAADEMKEIEEDRRDNQKLEQEIKSLPDAELDTRLDKFMRD